MTTTVVAVSLVVVSLCGALCQDISDVGRLIDDKMEHYNLGLRPVKYQNDSVNVSITFHMFTIQKFDEVLETVSVVGYLGLSWHDVHYVWNASDYAGVQEFITDEKVSWKPSITNINTASALRNLVSDLSPMYVEATGQMTYYPGVELHVMCSVNVLYYPFDRQVCQVIFAPWGYEERHIRLNPVFDKVGLDLYEAIGPWRIVSTRVMAAKHNSIIYEIELHRQPEFLLLNIILPIVLLAFLNTVVFFIPSESGERISYCLTVLLAIAVFLTIVGENLPKTSKPMSIFSFYLIGVLVLSVFVTFATILSMRMFFRNDNADGPSAFWVSMYHCFRCTRKRKWVQQVEMGRSSSAYVSNDSGTSGKRKYTKRNSIEEKQHHISRTKHDLYGNGGKDWQRTDNGLKQFVDSLHAKRLHSDYHQIVIGRTNQDQNGVKQGVLDETSCASGKDVRASWKDISNMVDILSFWLFTVLLVSGTVVVGLLIGIGEQV